MRGSLHSNKTLLLSIRTLAASDKYSGTWIRSLYFLRAEDSPGPATLQDVLGRMLTFKQPIQFERIPD